MNKPQKITIVVPFLNEKENLPVLLERVSAVFAGREEDWELLLVDDGSTDGSAEWAVAQAKENRHVRVLRLSRNFGHQLAITAGLDRADGDAVVAVPAAAAHREAGSRAIEFARPRPHCRRAEDRKRRNCRYPRAARCGSLGGTAGDSARQVTRWG